MLRTVSLMVALAAYAGVVAAECGAAHEAKNAAKDEQAQGAKAPQAKTARRSPPQQSVKVACEGNGCAATPPKQEVKQEGKSSPQS